MAARAGAEARRDPLPLREPPDRGEGRPDRPDVARDGKGEGGGRRRRAGGDRHEPLHGRRGPPHVRADDSVGAARQVQHERASADRRGRRDHAVELPDRDPVLEDRAGARLREHRRLQAGDGHARSRRALRRAVRGGRAAGRSAEHRARRGRRGRGWEDDSDVGPVINKRALEKIHAYTKIGTDEGAKLLTGGEVATDNGLDKGFFYRPTIFGDVDPQMRVAQEEIFGPTTALIRVQDVDEAIRVSNGIKYGLSSSIFTRDVNKAFRAMRDLEAGITYINAGTIGAEVHLPFGGTKDTGNGHREAGQAALDVFTEWKSIYVDYSGKLQKAQIDNVKPGA